MDSDWQTVRIFISSTFQDMQAERDYLVRFVFPRLREQLLPRRLHLVEVDLRWGVTSEQDASDVCREIIQDCRPRFLCMLGGRYGTVPKGRELSITADEIHFGVLDEQRTNVYALFYFRHGTVTEEMSRSSSRAVRERKRSDQAGKLARLKRDIRKAHYRPFLYRPRWNPQDQRLFDFKAFGDRVEKDILATVDQQYGTRPPARPDAYAAENAAIETFVAERIERFVLGSRKAVLESLLAHARARDGENYLCLTGAPGSGKSALLCYFGRHDAFRDQASVLLLSHFVGATPGAADLRLTLRRLCNELKTGCPDIAAEIPDDLEKLCVAFPEFLRQACRQKTVVLLLDGVDQFDAAALAAGLHWLPTDLPANARVVVSALDGPALAELRRRSPRPREIVLPPLSPGDGEAIIGQFQERYRKTFEPGQQAQLLGKTDAVTPLYLLTALEELRTLGTYEEIGERIRELPTTTGELFAWILRRLESDDGFRDDKGRRVGQALVSRFAALLCASRHGLSQRELVDLLDPGDPQGNVAALLFLLRSHLMLRGELIDFYHGQFRAAAEKTRMGDGGRQQAVHGQLADYFRSQADPDHQSKWQIAPRPLGELGFHLSRAARNGEFAALFSQLGFLAARVAAGQVYETIADFALAEAAATPDLAPWRDFLQKHAQRLLRHPDMLVALANHEGFAAARAQADAVVWRRPWLRTAPEALPEGEAQIEDGLHVEIAKNLEFPWGGVAAIAPQKAVAFQVEQLGTVSVLDLETMRKTDALLAIKRQRPLVLVCSPDAACLAVFHDTGAAAMYRCIFGPNGRPANLELAAEFDFHLPECEDPVAVWHDGALHYQASPGRLASIALDRPEPSEEALPDGAQGELSALVFNGGARLIAMRQGPDTLLVPSGGAPLRRPAAQVTAACSCGEASFAVDFSDGALVVYALGDTLETKAEMRPGLLRGALGWDGSRLLWLDETGGFMSWRPGEAAPRRVSENREIFPETLHILPRHWLAQPDGSVLLGTTHSLVAFRVLEGAADDDGRLEEVFGGPLWRAVRKRGNDQWFLEKARPREKLLGRGVMGRLYCDADGGGRFYAASGYGPGLVFDLPTFRSMPMRDCPPGINMAAGEQAGGCWFADRRGIIYYADAGGRCNRAGSLELFDIAGSRIVNCGDHLVWVGTTSKFFPETGTEAARTLVFFRKGPGSPPTLERAGEWIRHPREGVCLAACFDPVSRNLVTFWESEARGGTRRLRIGSVEAFLGGQLREVEVQGLSEFSFVQASLSADGKYLAVVNAGGEVSCLSVADGRVVASLAGSIAFTAVAPGARDAEFWLVESRARICRCALKGGAA